MQNFGSTSTAAVTATAITHAIMGSMERRNKWECHSETIIIMIIIMIIMIIIMIMVLP